MSNGNLDPIVTVVIFLIWSDGIIVDLNTLIFDLPEAVVLIFLLIYILNTKTTNYKLLVPRPGEAMKSM